MLFSTLHLKSKEEAYENMNIIMKISSHIWFVAVVISLWQFVFQIHYRADFSEFTRRQGFYDARLFGIFSDPNFAAVTSLIVIVFCYYLNKKCEKKCYRSQWNKTHKVHKYYAYCAYEYVKG